MAAWTRETLERGSGGGSELPSVLGHDEGHQDGPVAWRHRCSQVGVTTRVVLKTLVSDPILQAKPSTHRMYAQDQLFHIYE
jgi:hypothetical protein